MPEATTPTLPAPDSVLKFECSPFTATTPISSTKTLCRTRATAGTGTKRRASRLKGTSADGASGRGPSTTGPRKWLTRVVVRSITGRPVERASSKAALVMSLASWAVEGSKQGIWAKRAMVRLSCSFWLEWQPGSSAESNTKPPGRPV